MFILFENKYINALSRTYFSKIYCICLMFAVDLFIC